MALGSGLTNLVKGGYGKAKNAAKYVANFLKADTFDVAKAVYQGKGKEYISSHVVKPVKRDQYIEKDKNESRKNVIGAKNDLLSKYSQLDGNVSEETRETIRTLADMEKETDISTSNFKKCKTDEIYTVKITNGSVEGKYQNPFKKQKDILTEEITGIERQLKSLKTKQNVADVIAKTYITKLKSAGIDVKDIYELNNKINGLVSEKTKFEKSVRDYDNKLAKMSGINNKYDSTQKKINELREKLNKAEQYTKKYVEAMKNLGVNVNSKNLEKQVSDLASQKKNYERELDKYSKELTEFKKLNNERNETATKIRSLHLKINTGNDFAKDYQVDLNNSGIDIGTLKSQESKYQTDLGNLGNDLKNLESLTIKKTNS